MLTQKAARVRFASANNNSGTHFTHLTHFTSTKAQTLTQKAVPVRVASATRPSCRNCEKGRDCGGEDLRQGTLQSRSAPKCIYACICMYMYIHTYMLHIYVYIYIYMYVYMCVCMYVYMYTNTHTHVHTYVCMLILLALLAPKLPQFTCFTSS